MDEAPPILVVEDDDVLRRMLATSLGRIAPVVTAANAADALAWLRQGAPPSVVVSDVMMPGMSGLELARQLRRDPRLRDVPVVLLSARTGPRDVVEGINAGARHYVTKPFRTRDLETKVAKYVREARLTRASMRPAPPLEAEVTMDVDLSDFVDVG